MGAAASQPAPGAPSSFRSKRCARPRLPDIEPSAPDKNAQMAQKNVVLTDMNLALCNQCKQFRVENAPSAPDAEEARLPLGVGRGQLINMMLERTNQRLKQATAPDARMFNS